MANHTTARRRSRPSGGTLPSELMAAGCAALGHRQAQVEHRRVLRVQRVLEAEPPTGSATAAARTALGTTATASPRSPTHQRRPGHLADPGCRACRLHRHVRHDVAQPGGPTAAPSPIATNWLHRVSLRTIRPVSVHLHRRPRCHSRSQQNGVVASRLMQGHVPLCCCATRQPHREGVWLFLYALVLVVLRGRSRQRDASANSCACQTCSA